MRMLQKLSVRLILFQLLALHLFGNAFFRFYYFLDADFYECFFWNLSRGGGVGDCLEIYPDRQIGDLISEPFYYMFYGKIFGLILIIIVNLIRKKSFWNTLLVIIGYILLLFMGGFSNRYLDTFTISIGRFFSDKIWSFSLIASLTSFMLGMVLIWFSVKISYSKKSN
jgi:hypothetical protein